MEVKGIVWLGVRTPKFQAMRAFLEDVIRLPIAYDGNDSIAYQLMNGDRIEIISAEAQENQHFTTGPVAGFEVDNIDQARAELESQGIVFIGPIYRNESGHAWTSFTGPDDNIYELSYVPQK